MGEPSHSLRFAQTSCPTETWNLSHLGNVFGRGAPFGAPPFHVIQVGQVPRPQWGA